MGKWTGKGNVASAMLRTPKQRLAVLEVYQEEFNQRVRSMARKLHDGQMTAAAWERSMRQEIKDLHLNALFVGKGGNVDGITQADYGRVGYYLREQYEYLHGYAESVVERGHAALEGLTKPYSQKALEYRSTLYAGSAKASLYRGMVGNLLPQLPGDGNTQCLTNCKCYLEFEEGDEPGLVLVYWRTTEAEHCEDCLRLEEEWSPYKMYLPVGMTAREVVPYLNFFMGLGGPGSGNWGHRGRPGKVGGSLPRDAGMSVASGHDWLERYKAKTGKEHPFAQKMKKGADDYGGASTPTPEDHSYQNALDAVRNVEKLTPGSKFLIKGLENEAPESYLHGIEKKVASDKNRSFAKDEIVSELARRTGESYKDVNTIIAEWAKSSNDHDYRSLCIQEAAADEFGAELSDWQKGRLDEYGPGDVDLGEFDSLEALREATRQAWDKVASNIAETKEEERAFLVRYQGLNALYTNAKEKLAGKSHVLGEITPENHARTRKILRAMYEYTQEKFAEAGITHVRLYRGVYANEIEGYDDVKTGEVFKMKTNALESWSTSIEVARGFGQFVTGIEVPVERILGTARSGFGCLRECEIILMGNVPGVEDDLGRVMNTGYEAYNPNPGPFGFVGNVLQRIRDLTGLALGGPGSGNWGHRGRPGKVGGSLPRDAGMSIKSGQDWLERYKKKTGKEHPYAKKTKGKGEGKGGGRYGGASKPVESGLTWNQAIKQNNKSLENVTPETEMLFAGLNKSTSSWYYGVQKYTKPGLNRSDAKDELVFELAQRTGEPYEDVNEVIHQWAKSSNDNDYRSLCIQEAAAAEFDGVELSPWQKKKLKQYRVPEMTPELKREMQDLWDDFVEAQEEYNDAMYDSDISPEDFRVISERKSTLENDYYDLKDKVRGHVLGANMPENQARTRKILRAMYEYTQEWFYNNDITHVRLYRGVSPQDWQNEYSAGDVVKLKANALESWSTSLNVANGFGTFVTAIDVPVERVMGSCRSGFGCLDELEMVVLGNVSGTSDRARVMRDTESRRNA